MNTAFLNQPSTSAIIEQIQEESNRFSTLTAEVSKAIAGQLAIIDFIKMAILCDGHILLEGVPGVAKTTMIKAISQVIGLNFQRIQFTPDLLPADLIGTLVYNQKTGEFDTKKGPIFSNLILADEINRAPAKVQAALLEAMQERQVTIGATSFKLDLPFLVFATQNPIEQEGTYRLPEAQLDRFMFKLFVDYPTPQEEKEILKKVHNLAHVYQVLSKEDLLRAKNLVDAIYVDDKIVDYIVKIVSSTRGIKGVIPAMLQKEIGYIQSGVSPRATLALHQAARANAFLKKRHFVTPDDVKAVCPAILRHRLVLTYEAEADGVTTDNLIQRILHALPTP